MSGFLRTFLRVHHSMCNICSLSRTYTSFIYFEKDVNRDPKPEPRAIQLQKRSRATNRRWM